MSWAVLKRFRYILLHLALGFLSAIIPWFSTVWVLIFMAGAVFFIFKDRNRGGTAHLAASYIMGIELALRMTKASLPYEFGKYGVIILIVLGLLVEKGSKKPPMFGLIYILALIPSIFLIEYDTFELMREQIAFNLSGPFALFVCLYYFYKRKVTSEEISRIFLFFIYPIISMLVIIYFRLPDFREYAFKTVSDSALSGGFGANQVSVITSFAFMIFPLCWLLNISVTKNRLLDTGIALVSLASSLFTFSRGGLVTVAVSLLACMLITMASGQKVEQIRRIFVASVIVGIIGTVSFIYLNNLSGGALESRYLRTVDPNGGRYANEEVEVDVSGRDVLFFSELNIFLEHPLMGVGPGMAAYKYHYNIFGKGVIAAHTEQTRMLAEHGLYGVIAFICIFIYPIGIFRRMTTSGKVIAAAMIIFSFITMTHNATRLAIVAFIYGLAFIDYIDLTPSKRNPLIRTQAVNEL